MKIFKDMNKNRIQLSSNNEYLASYTVKTKPTCFFKRTTKNDLNKVLYYD